MYPTLQIHIGVWLTTRHSAFSPHEPGQGSLHFWFMHARLVAHSELLTHSGRQFGGIPIKSLRQLHAGVSPIGLHSVLGPHGDGWHGLIGSRCGGCSITAWQRTNGSPVYRDGQLHIGLWLTTLHLALTPHVPGHGSWHFWFEQALFCKQSELTVHSGRHVGGLPI